MRKTLIFFAAVVSILSFTLPLEAEEKYGRFFAGAGVSGVIERFDTNDLKQLFGSVNTSVDDSWGLNIFGGYWWHKHFAVEGNFNWYDDFNGQAGGLGFDVSIWLAMLDLKVYAPALWEDTVFPYLRAGGGIMNVKIDSAIADPDDSDFAYDLGLGFDIFVRERVSVGLDIKHVWGTGDVTEFNHWAGTIRAAYHF